MLRGVTMSEEWELVQWFDEVGKDDAGLVGDKGASLGEMYRNLCDCGVQIPNGFNVNVEAYARFVDAEVTSSTECGITSISVTPDTVMAVRLAVAEAEAKAGMLEFQQEWAE